MNADTRFILGSASWLVLFALVVSASMAWGFTFLVISAVIGLVVAIPWPESADQVPAEQVESGKSPEEIQEEVLRLVTKKVEFLESVEREHGPEARERVEELVQQHEFLKGQGGQQ